MIALLTIVGQPRRRRGRAHGLGRVGRRQRRCRREPVRRSRSTDLRVELTDGDADRRGRLARRRAPARSSGSSASRAAARRRPRSRCSATRAPGVAHRRRHVSRRRRALTGRRRDAPLRALRGRARLVRAAGSRRRRSNPSLRIGDAMRDDAATRTRRGAGADDASRGVSARPPAGRPRPSRAASRTSSRAASSSASRSRSALVCEPPRRRARRADDRASTSSRRRASSSEIGRLRRERGLAHRLRLARPRGRGVDRRPRSPSCTRAASSRSGPRSRAARARRGTPTRAG